MELMPSWGRDLRLELGASPRVGRTNIRATDGRQAVHEPRAPDGEQAVHEPQAPDGRQAVMFGQMFHRQPPLRAVGRAILTSFRQPERWILTYEDSTSGKETSQTRPCLVADTQGVRSSL